MNMTILIVIFGLLVFTALVFLLIFFLWPKKQADAIEMRGPRRRMDTLDYQEPDEELMNRKFLCPKCNSEVYYDEEECPSCGNAFVKGEFECPSCSKMVDPREKECPYCGEILLEEPYVCPNCSNPVSPDSTRCDRCNITYWSPIKLDQRTLKNRKRPVATEERAEEPKEDNKEERLHPGRSRKYR